ncbi:MAG: IclR family transcriptional regulator [Anaerolineae bacterium]|nr:IclR family transcriptional regulator [Anaerolineae bacterium]
MNDETAKSSVIHKVLDILLLFQNQQEQYSAEEISQHLDIPKSTVYRYIRILHEKGLLEKVGSAEYGLGAVLIEMGRKTLASNREMRLVALPSMKRLAEATGESVSLMRRYNHRAVCVESIEGRHALRVTIERGRTQPLHAGASSIILLAALPEDQWDEVLDVPLERFTNATITDLGELRAHVRDVIDQGYAISDGEIDVGARAIAVPLRDHRNEIVAALSIEAPASRMTNEVILHYIDMLKHEARTIHHELH